MGLRIKQPRWLKTQQILTLIAVFALAVQPMGGFVSSLVANAAEAPFEVTTSCSSDRKVVLTTTTRQAELPGVPQDARNWYAAVSYQTDLGSSSSQSLSEGDIDTWSKTVSDFNVSAGTAKATVIGGYTQPEDIKVWGIKVGSWDKPYVYIKTFTAHYSDETCESAPVASDTSLNVNEGVVATGNVSVTDTDNDSLKYTVVKDVEHGSLALNKATGEYTYKPNSQFIGSDSFTFKANDGYLDSNTATVSITVHPDTTGPTIKNIKLNGKDYVSGMLLNKGIAISADIDDLNGINEAAFTVKAPSGTDLSTHNSSDIAASGDLTKSTDGHWTATFDSKALANNYSADGSYELVITAKDNAQAKNSSTKDGLMLTFDNTAPSAPKISPDSGSKKGIVNVTVTPKDSDSSVDKVSASATYNGNPVDISSVWSGDKGAYALDTTELMRGTIITVTATAKDTIGNVSDAASVQYSVENNTPVLVVNPDNSTSSSMHTLTGSVSPVTATVTVYFNGASYVATVDASGNWRLDLDVSELQRGRYTYTVFADAGYGNTTTSNIYNLQVGAPVGNGLNSNTASMIIPVIPARTIATSSTAGIFTQADAEQGLPSRSLGKPAVKGENTLDSSKNTAALTPSAHGWQLFSIAWYWWLLVVAAFVGAWWWLAAARRRRAEE